MLHTIFHKGSGIIFVNWLKIGIRDPQNSTSGFGNCAIFGGHDQLVFKLVKIQLVTDSVSDTSVSDVFS